MSEQAKPYPKRADLVAIAIKGRTLYHETHRGSTVCIVADAERLADEFLRLNNDWQPTPENINELPEAVRRFVHDLETRCDPAGDIAALKLAQDENAMLRKLIGNSEPMTPDSIGFLRDLVEDMRAGSKRTRGLLEKILATQERRYGDGTGLHLDMIHVANEIRALLGLEVKGPKALPICTNCDVRTEQSHAKYCAVCPKCGREFDDPNRGGR